MAKKTSFRYPPKHVSHCKLLVDKVYKKLASEVNVFAEAIRKSVHFLECIWLKKIIKDSTSSGIPEIIQDTTNVSWIKVLSPAHKGIRDKGKKRRGAVTIKYADRCQNGLREGATQSLFDQALKVPVIRREVKVLRDDWSSTDTVDDFYTIANRGTIPLKEVLVRTELFRDELEIFDAEGRKLPFVSQKAEAEKLDEKELKYSPYSFLVSLHSPLDGFGKAVIRLRYKMVSENPSFAFQLLRGIKDSMPFVENEGYLYRFFEIGKVFGGDDRELTFTAKLSEGTTATSYVILGVKDGNGETGDPSVEYFDCKHETQPSGEAKGAVKKAKPCEAVDDTNFYCEGRDLFFALSKAKLDKLRYLVVILRVSPQTRIFAAVSSIQLLTVSVLVTLALQIHSQPFSTSFSLITGLFLALLTLLLYPERSRLMDTRISVAIYSVILSIALILHALSIYINLKIISLLFDTFPVLYFLLVTIVSFLLFLYIGYCLLEWAYRRYKIHCPMEMSCRNQNDTDGAN